MDLQPLYKLLPPKTLLSTYSEALPAAFDYAQIDNPNRAALFLANTAHETNGFRVFEENLWYTAARLAVVWPRHFKGKDGKPNELAYELEKNQKKTADFVYQNRFGNGPASSGDGYLYRGRGLPMLTFKDNYAQVDAAFNMNGKIVSNPNMLIMPYWSALSAAHFFKSRGLGELADQGKIKEARKRWQGGSLGLVEVTSYYNKFLTVMDQVL